MNKKDKIAFWVRIPVWSESEKSWYILIKCTERVASEGFWFPKKSCKLEPLEEGKAVLTVPKWLYEKNKLKEHINENQYL